MSFQAHRSSIIGGILALLLVGVLAFKDLPDSSLLQRIVVKESSRLPKGAVAPDFQLPGVNGETMGLADLKGAMSVLVFVTLTCPYCRQLKEELVSRGMPDLKSRLVFIIRKAQSPQEIPTEVQELETKVVRLFPVLQDSAGSTFEEYKANSVPTSYLLDKEGKVVDSGVGVPAGLKLVQKLVNETLVAQSDTCDSCK